MTISAIRFKSLDKQTNVAIADFKTATSDILNSAIQGADKLTDQIQSFFAGPSATPTASTVDALKRTGKDAMGSIKDIGSYSAKDIDKLVSGLLSGNQTAQNLFNKLGPKCQVKGLGSGGFGKPYDSTVDCGGKKRKGKKDGCNSSEYANILDKLTGGAYSSTFKDINAALQNLIGLSKFGYDMNLCGVFSALTGGLDNNVLSRASGAVLGHLATSGNVLGVLDVAGASSGLHTLKENPSGITDTFKNFKIPSEVKKADLPNLNDRFVGAMTLLDNKWDSSKHDDMISANHGNGYNDAVNEMFHSKQTDRGINIANLDTPVATDFDYMATAYAMNNNVNMSTWT